ncbi:MAG: hypothetical protein HWN65_18875 [Candidatus Helarchaeota archaeon]|nr:hypothetical protein [Candidatus Helarchaeota archaeon]
MAEKALSLWPRIMGFVAAVLSGLIFVLGSLRATFFGESFIDYLTGDPLYLPLDLASTYDILMKVAGYAGYIILAAAVLILLGRVRIAKIILFIFIGTGLLSFFIPVIASLSSTGLSPQDLLTVLLNGDATMYLVATLFGIIAKLYCDKAT